MGRKAGLPVVTMRKLQLMCLTKEATKVMRTGTTIAEACRLVSVVVAAVNRTIKGT